jgi:hypothetical protein
MLIFACSATISLLCDDELLSSATLRVLLLCSNPLCITTLFFLLCSNHLEQLECTITS